MGFLSILLSHAPGSHIHPPLEDRCPRRSTTSQECPLLAHVCASSTGTLPCRVHSGLHAHATHVHHSPAHAEVTARVGSDTTCNTPGDFGLTAVTSGSSIGSLD